MYLAAFIRLQPPVLAKPPSLHGLYMKSVSFTEDTQGGRSPPAAGRAAVALDASAFVRLECIHVRESTHFKPNSALVHICRQCGWPCKLVRSL